MNNDEKIIQLLESMQSDIKDLKGGQATLEQGQALTNSRLESLEQGQAALEQGQAALEQGQAALEQGQALTNSRLESLEQGQALTNSRLESLEQGQALTSSRLESLEQYQSTTNSRLGTLEKSVENLSQSQTRMENNLIEHIRGLWDFHSVQTDVNNRILAALERIENKIEKHDIQIQVLDLTKSNKRKIK